MIRTLIIFVFTAFIVSCSEQDKRQIELSASTFDLTQARASVNQSILSLEKAFVARDTDAIVGAYTSKAHVLPSGHPAIEGADSIRAYVEKILGTNIQKIKIDSKQIWGDSTLLAGEGTYALIGKENTKLDKGKFIVLWKREAGNWKIYREMWTSDLPQNKIQFITDSSSIKAKK